MYIVADDELNLENGLDDEELEGTETEEDEQEGSETEGSEAEEFDLVLDGDEQAAPKGKKKTVTVPASTLAKLRETRRDARDKSDELERQLAEYKRKEQAAPQPKQAEAMPTLAGCDYDEDQHAQKMSVWYAKQTQNQLRTYQQAQVQEQQESERKQRMEGQISEHFQRAANLKVVGYQESEELVRNTLGHDLTDLMIASLGEGSEKVTYHLGKNPAALQALTQSLQDDPSGLKAMAHLGKLQGKLKLEPSRKTISFAPAADEALSGASSGQNDGAILKRLEKVHKLSDRGQFRKMKAELVASGRTDLLKRNGYI